MSNRWSSSERSERVETFGERLTATFETSGHLCVGIDPHPYLLEQWGLPDSADGAQQLGLRVVDATVGRAGIVKPQVAFFERFGSRGFAALEIVIATARESGLLVIADAKRGDVGTSVEAYAQAWLTPGSPLEADAVTMSAFQGVGSLESSFHLAQSGGKGIFVLAATSNPESAELQTAVLDRGETAGRSVAAGIVSGVKAWNTGSLGSFGVVIGATIALEDYGIERQELASTPILAPGFGHQGADIHSLPQLFGAATGNVIVAASRSILSAGPGGVADSVASQRDGLARVYAS